MLLGFLVVPQMLDSISVWQYMRLGYDGNIRLNLENILLHEKRLNDSHSRPDEDASLGSTTSRYKCHYPMNEMFFIQS